VRVCFGPNGEVNPLHAVVLVEGNSDRVALQTLAERCGRDLAGEGIEVVAMGGITNTRTFASQYGPRGLGVPLGGLYDAADEDKVRHGLAEAGVDEARDADGLSGLGFFKCSEDLEDELIRSLGVDAVEAVIEAAGESNSLRLLSGMPAQRDWTREAVLRRFIGVRSGRKARYAALLVDALEPGSAPEPLAAVLAQTTRWAHA
jgi:OLD-like protein